MRAEPIETWWIFEDVQLVSNEMFLKAERRNSVVSAFRTPRKQLESANQFLSNEAANQEDAMREHSRKMKDF